MLPENIRPNKKLLLLAAAGIVFLSGVSTVYLNRHGIAHHLKTFRAERLTAKSLIAGESGDWKEAERIAIAAYQLDPGSIETLRQAFTACANTSSGSILQVSRSLFAHPKATLDDKTRTMAFFVVVGDVVTFQQMYASLPDEERNAAPVMDIRTRYLAKRGRYKEALKELNRLENKRESADDRLLRARILIHLTDRRDTNLAEAQQLIHELFVSEKEAPSLSIEAFLLLYQIPEAARDTRRFATCRRRLETLNAPEPIPVEQDLLATEIESLLGKSPPEKIVTNAITKWEKTEPVALCRWLLKWKNPRHAREVLERTGFDQSPDSYRIYIQTLLMLRDWEKAESLLKSSPSFVRQFEVYAYRAAIAGAQSENAIAGLRWERSLELASLSRGRDDLLQLARLAADSENAAICQRAVTEILMRRSAIPLAAEDLTFYYSCLAKNDRALSLLSTSKSLLKNEPGNPILVNNVAWLEILTGSFDPAMLPKLQNLVETRPGDLALKSTLALALCETDKPEEALRILTPSEATDFTHTDAAVLCLALRLTEKSKEAASLITRIDWSSMIPAERAYFQAALLPR